MPPVNDGGYLLRFLFVPSSFGHAAKLELGEQRVLLRGQAAFQLVQAVEWSGPGERLGTEEAFGVESHARGLAAGCEQGLALTRLHEPALQTEQSHLNFA